MSRRKSNRRNQQAMESLCGELGDEDGADPRYFYQAPRHSGHSRKAMQLCKQVSRALSYAFSACDDDVIRELYIQSLEPAPDQSRLMVVVTPLGEELDQVQVLTKLSFALPFFRNEVARSINRKKVPELMFQYLPKAAMEPPTE